jgi:hypothetical protein
MFYKVYVVLYHSDADAPIQVVVEVYK